MNEDTAMNDTIEINNENAQRSLNGETESHNSKSPSNDENKAPDSVSDSIGGKKVASTPGGSSTPVGNTGSRSKKRKKTPRDATAPKQPLTGYFRFLNDRREKVRADNPTMSFTDITKLLAAEWSSLPAEQKQQYLNAAEQDKERYNREFSDYKQTEAYRLFSERQSSEKQNESNKKERNGGDTTTEPIENLTDKDNEFSGFDIPIFTEEFLDHNKSCEAELRQLRKATSDYEAQNAVLQRHVDSLYAAVNRLESETNQQRATNQSLQRHLESLRTQLAGSFASIPLPGTHEGANLQNIDSYVERLETLLSGNMEPTLRSAAQNAISRFELMG